ncbi:MAG: WD40 repeat domain-containing protein, partial [Proteobacteria bacterium]|nr:WD40 repeat domain-containing protein [Pseudomonadota bacterium]
MDLAIENKSLRQISLSLSSDEKYIMTGGIYTNYALWDISDGKPVTIAKLDDNIVNANYMHVFLTANNKYTVFVYYISGLATAVVRERESGMEVKRVAIPIPLSALAMSLSMPTPLWNASMSSNGRYLLIGAVLQLFIYDLDNSKFIELQSPYTNNPFLLRGINANALSKDGKYALSGGQGKITKLWEVERGKLKKEFDNSSWIYSVAFSDDSTYVASGDGDGNIKLWNTKTGSFEKEFRGHAGKVSAVSFSSDGRYIISGSWDNSIRIWDVISGKEIKTFHNMDRAVNTIRNFLIGDPIKGVTSVSFSKDGKYVYATIGGALKIFSTITDEEVASFIAFEDGEWIVITPEGYYNSSSNAHKFISVNVNPTSNADSRAKAAYTMENF